MSETEITYTLPLERMEAIASQLEAVIIDGKTIEFLDQKLHSAHVQAAALCAQLNDLFQRIENLSQKLPEEVRLLRLQLDKVDRAVALLMEKRLKEVDRIFEV